MANKLTVEAVAVCGLLALGVGLYYYAQRTSAQKAVQALNLEYAQLEARIKAASAQQVREDAAMAAAKTAAERGAPRAAPGGAAPESANDIFMREATENPELREALTKFFVAGFRIHYAELARTMGLSEAQLSQLAEANFKKWSDRLDLSQAARLSGNMADPDANAGYKALVQKLSETYDDAVRGVVGPAGFQQIQDFDRSYEARSIANRVAAGAASDSAPLTPEQTDQLARLVADGSPEYRQGGSTNVNRLEWDRVMGQAASLLTPAQLTSLNSIRAAQDMQSVSALFQIDRGGPR